MRNICKPHSIGFLGQEVELRGNPRVQKDVVCEELAVCHREPHHPNLLGTLDRMVILLSVDDEKY